jgi:hypothetical protein
VRDDEALVASGAAKGGKTIELDRDDCAASAATARFAHLAMPTQTVPLPRRLVRAEAMGRHEKKFALPEMAVPAFCSPGRGRLAVSKNLPRMKNPLNFILLAASLVLAANAHAQDKNFHVFLAFGQSNMEGFPIRDAATWEELRKDVDPRFQVLAAVDFTPGARYTGPERKAGQWYTAIPPLCRMDSGLCPADFFGRTLVAGLPVAIKVGVVNVSVAGAKIEIFDKEGYQAYLDSTPPNDFKRNVAKIYGGNPYQKLVELGKEAQKVGVIKGILLHQGESNSGDKEWPAKVKKVYEDLLKDLNLKAADVPLLAGELVGGSEKGMNKNIIAELPKTIPTAHVISTDGVAFRSDNLHFTPEGYRELGIRYGQTMLSLLGVKPAAAK